MSKPVGIRMTDEIKRELEQIETDYGVTKGDVVRLIVEGISRGHYTIISDSIEPTGEYLRVIRPAEECCDGDSEYERLGFSGVLRQMRKKGYPDDAIRRMNEQSMIQISDMPKYRNRRASTDWGS